MKNTKSVSVMVSSLKTAATRYEEIVTQNTNTILIMTPNNTESIDPTRTSRGVSLVWLECFVSTVKTSDKKN